MDIVKRNVAVEMVRDNFDRIPRFSCPDGHSLRWYEPEDETLWLTIWKAADQFLTIDDKIFESEFGGARDLLQDRQFFLLDKSGRAIGTSTAWFDGDRENRTTGRIHWVAVIPEKQGLGLSKPLMSTTCDRLQKLGYKNAVLGTSTGRLSAINLYAAFGFRPNIRSREDEAIWNDLQPRLKTPIQVTE